MWKKDEEQTAQPRAESTPRVSRPTTASQASGRATIGPSISIKGDVTGSEDLLIQGRVDGSVTLDDHAVGVGSEGRVKADIVGRLITVEGHVEGDLTAQEQIVLRGSAQVKGDIKAPRVVLEDGATFRGLVDMGSAAPKKEQADTKSASSSSSSTSSASGSSSPSGSSSSSASSSGSSSGNGATDGKDAGAKSGAKSGASASGSKSSTGSGSSSSKESGKSAQQART